MPQGIKSPRDFYTAGGFYIVGTLISILFFSRSFVLTSTTAEVRPLRLHKSREDMSAEDGVLVSEDGLVYPRFSVKLPCPCAL